MAQQVAFPVVRNVAVWIQASMPAAVELAIS
jgi:hypothetical protein